MTKAKTWWAFGAAELTPDPAMTRERLARAMRAWRRGANGVRLARIGAHDYTVTLNGLTARVQVRP